MRIHDARHSYASRALALGESLPMIGRLLGHTQVETTARYAHLAQDSVRDSGVRVAVSIAGDFLTDYSGAGTSGSIGRRARRSRAGAGASRSAPGRRPWSMGSVSRTGNGRPQDPGAVCRSDGPNK